MDKHDYEKKREREKSSDAGRWYHAKPDIIVNGVMFVAFCKKNRHLMIQTIHVHYNFTSFKASLQSKEQERESQRRKKLTAF
jgi:hypothetical protein